MSILRRPARAVLAVATATAVVTPVAATAQAAPASATTDPSTAAAAFLAGELAAHDDAMPASFGDGSDFGLTADAVLALAAAGVAGDQATATTERLAAEVDDIVAPVFDGVAYPDPGLAAKLVLVAVAQGLDPTGFGGRDLVTDVRDGIDGDGAIGGSLFAHAVGVTALATATPSDDPDLAATVDHLLGAQCADGGFPSFVGEDCTSEGDATGLAVQALRAVGGTEADAAVADATQWLLDTQAEDGSFGVAFGGDPVPNSNTTGLAAWALRAVGETAAADQAAAWVAGTQLPCTAPDGDRGAIAYDPAAREAGIAPATRDQFRRTTAQALLAFDAPGYHELDATTATAGVPAACFTAGWCPDDAGVTIAVDTRSLGDAEGPVARCVPWTEGMDGFDLLARGGFATTADGGALCTIEGLPTDVSPACFGSASDPNGYWSYWTAGRTDDAWSFAPTGPADRAPQPGDVEAWAWEDDYTDTTSSAPRATPDVASAAAWLRGRLVDGDHVEISGDGFSYIGYGQTADAALAFRSTGTEPAALQDVLAFLDTPSTIASYVTGTAFGDGATVTDPAYAGATGKLTLLAATTGLDPRDVGGTDLVATLTSLEAEDGFFRDRSDYGDFSNVLGQSFAILGLTAADGVDPSAASVAALVDTQCADGGFPETPGEACTSSPDATGLAVQALAAATDRSEVRQAALDDAVAWLVANRDGDGAWSAFGDQNVNSTGYAGLGLVAAGRDASTSVAWLDGLQGVDGGLPISPGGPSDQIATAQALPLFGRGATLVELAGDLPADPLPLPTEPTDPEPTDPTDPGAATVGRAAGVNRYATAIEISRDAFADGAANTVVLARGDVYADALAGTPVASSGNGPLLITPTGELLDIVLAEVQRVLPAGGTVHVLGGERALAPAVARGIEDAGYEVVRLAGDDRWSTSVAIASFLGDPSLQLVTTGVDFPDALTAGTAAAARGGAVLLTRGDAPDADVSAYLDAHPGEVVAVGGPASRAYPGAEPLVGADREATAVAVADRFFPDADTLTLARRDDFADALAGGARSAQLDAPLVLTGTDVLPDPTATWLCGVGDRITDALLFGGTNAIGVSVADAVADRLAGTGCDAGTAS